MSIRKRRTPNRLRVLRAERHMTQFQLANKSRLTPSRISFIENGHIEPTPTERAALARAFKVSEPEVFPEAPEAVAS